MDYLLLPWVVGIVYAVFFSLVKCNYCCVAKNKTQAKPTPLNYYIVDATLVAMSWKFCCAQFGVKDLSKHDVRIAD